MNNKRLAALKALCKEFPFEAYESIDNNRLAVYAIRLLQNNRIPVTQEAVAVTLFLLFPKKFSLVGFEQYPDVERTHRTLLQLGPKWRNWATGNTHIGFSLNRNGELVFDQVNAALKNPSKRLVPFRRIAPRQRTRPVDQEIKEIEATTLFKEYSNGKRDDFSEYAIWELLSSYPYAPKEAVNERIKSMTESAKLAERKDIIEFLKWVRGKFPTIFGK